MCSEMTSPNSRAVLWILTYKHAHNTSMHRAEKIELMTRPSIMKLRQQLLDPQDVIKEYRAAAQECGVPPTLIADAISRTCVGVRCAVCCVCDVCCAVWRVVLCPGSDSLTFCVCLSVRSSIHYVPSVLEAPRRRYIIMSIVVTFLVDRLPVCSFRLTVFLCMRQSCATLLFVMR